MVLPTLPDLPVGHPVHRWTGYIVIPWSVWGRVSGNPALPPRVRRKAGREDELVLRAWHLAQARVALMSAAEIAEAAITTADRIVGWPWPPDLGGVEPALALAGSGRQCAADHGGRLAAVVRAVAAALTDPASYGTGPALWAVAHHRHPQAVEAWAGWIVRAALAAEGHSSAISAIYAEMAEEAHDVAVAATKAAMDDVRWVDPPAPEAGESTPASEEAVPASSEGA